MSSSGIDYQLVIDAKGVEEMLTAAGQNFARYRKQWMISAANTIRREVEDRAPVGVAGHAGQGLSHNISIDYDGDYVTASIGPNGNVSSYAEGVEKGTRPHIPPHGPDSSLAQWAELKGLNVYAVAKTIEKRGTKPHPFLAPALAAKRDEVVRSFNEGVNAYIGRIVVGAL